MPELLALDPVEMHPDRVELPLNELGLEVLADGLDYGESSAALEKVRQAIGEGATDRRWPNIDCQVPLLVKAESDVPLAEVAQKLEQKAGLIQREGGSIRRDFDLGGGFAGSVMCPITTVGLPPLQGWLMVHRQAAPGVILKINRHPIWYATVEVEGEEVSASEARDLQWEIAEVLGSAPGLIRLRVKNEGEEDWRGLFCFIESRDLTEGDSALPSYEAEDLTPLGPAEVAASAGSSGGEVVQATGLTAGWVTILGSEISGVGHMTHRGVRRLEMRVHEPSPVAEAVQLRIEWRALGASTWTQNPIATVPVAEDFQVIDLGECRPQIAVLGDERWEWRLLARAPGGSGSVQIDHVHIAPTEQLFVVSAPKQPIAPAQQMGPRSPGAVTSESVGGSLPEVPWSSPENVKALDSSYATVAFEEGENFSEYLMLTELGFNIPLEASIADVVVTATCFATDSKCSAGWALLSEGEVVAFTEPSLSVLPTSESALSLKLIPFGPNPLTPAMLNADEFAVRFLASSFNPVGGNEVKVNAITVTAFYTEDIDENKVCFAGRSLEARSDGIFRQHPTDDVWGGMVPEGFLPFAPPSGLEGRPVRGVVIPSQGDFGPQADIGTNDLSILPVYRPGYLFAREAAAP